MLDGLPLIKRLLLCLLASAGLHGGLVLVAWQEAPLRQALLRAPLEVARVEFVASHRAAEIESAPAVDATKKILPSPARPVVTTAVSRPLNKAKTAQVAKPVEPVRRMVEESLMPPEQPLAELQARLVSSEAQDELSLPVAAPGLVEAPGADVSGHAATAGPSPPMSDVLLEAIPAYHSNPPPEYPSLARQRRWQGVVWLQVGVLATGEVSDVQVESSSGHAVLDRSATRSVGRWRFAPATRGGVPVASRVRLPVHFVLQEQ